MPAASEQQHWRGASRLSSDVHSPSFTLAFPNASNIARRKEARKARSYVCENQDLLLKTIGDVFFSVVLVNCRSTPGI